MLRVFQSTLERKILLLFHILVYSVIDIVRVKKVNLTFYGPPCALRIRSGA